MSYVFVGPDGETIWSPALVAGDLFVTAATRIATLEGMASGLLANASDFYSVDTTQLQSFATHLRDEYTWSDPRLPNVRKSTSWKVMVRPVLMLSAMLLERCGLPLEDVPDDMEEEVRELARILPR